MIGRGLAVAVLVALGPIVSPASPTPPVVLDLRGGGFTVIDDVETLRFDQDGVSVERGGRRTPLRRWDELRGVLEWGPSGALRPIGADAPFEGAAAIAEMLAIGEQVWRARTRLARGDLAGSLPLWSELDRRLAREASLQARIVAEGLLRTRVLRGDEPVARVEAALRALQLERDGWRLPADTVEALPRDGAGWPIAAWPLPVLDGAAIEGWSQRFGGSSVATEAAVLAALMRIEEVPPTLAALQDGDLPASWRRLLEIRRSPSVAAALAGRAAWLEPTGAGGPVEAARRIALVHAHLGARLLAETDDRARRRALVEWLCVAAAPGAEAPLVEWAWSSIEPVARAAALDTLAEYARLQRARAASGRGEPVDRSLERAP